MKLPFTLLYLLLAASPFSVAAEGHTNEMDCTHGMLFVSDADSTAVRAYDLNGASLANLPVVATIEIDVPVPEIVLATSGMGEVVSAIYRGQLDQEYKDGAVNFIHTGVTVESHGDHQHVSYSPPTFVENASFECARAIHYVTHADKIAIFCDGMLNATNLVNTTVWVVDETLFNVDGTSAIVFSTTLPGSHHGVAIPVDDNHVLYSLPTPERAAGNSTISSLPATFQMTDYDGNVLHSLNDTSSADASCAGFHGSWAVDNEFALACDDEHGGIVVLKYDAAAAVYSSRALMYPEEFPDHRTGSFAEHEKAPVVVGNFAGGDQFHLMSFQTTDNALSADNVLTLPARQCAYNHEQHDAELMLVFMPTGNLHVFKVLPVWNELAVIEVVPGMEACTEASMVAGHGQAFVMHFESQTLYALDLHDVHDGGVVVVTTTNLGFTPFSAVVGGVPPAAECMVDDHDHDNKEPDSTDSAATSHSLLLWVVGTVITMTVEAL